MSKKYFDDKDTGYQRGYEEGLRYAQSQHSEYIKIQMNVVEEYKKEIERLNTLVSNQEKTLDKWSSVAKRMLENSTFGALGKSKEVNNDSN